MRNAVMAKVPETALTVVRGSDILSCYQWNTKRARHFFCSTCGIYMFHRKRPAPDHFGVNIFCLQGFAVGSIPVRPTEGANMTVDDPNACAHWPGPRISRSSAEQT